MRSRRLTSNPAVAFMVLTLAGLFAGWGGCSASGSSANIAGGTGTGGVTSASGGPGGGGPGGAGMGGGTGTGTGSGAGDAGADAGPSCTAEQKLCNGMCVAANDPAYGCSPTFCTPCGTYANGAATCENGACALGTCTAGYSNCDGNAANGCETNTTMDPNNCGACGAECVVPNATASCVAGVCGVLMCNAGWTDCGGTVVDGGSGAGGGGAGDGGTVAGCFANLGSDPNNCGSCGMVCPGNEQCQAGVCGLYCPKGTADCTMPPMPDDTCSTTLGTNKNCNFCGDTCNLPNSTSQCTPGTGMNTCNLISCNPGYANCDTSAANGCETNTNTDANNCNSCGNVCPSGPDSTAVCVNGVCGLTCTTGYSNCDNNPANGCEVNTGGDPNNCGTCGMKCSQNNATEVCNSGVCTIMPCTSPYLDCDMNPADGCEVNPTNDVNNCGKCGNVCKTANGTPACNGGVCGIASCNAGYTHCAATGTNCETATGTDVNNCGTCGNACSTTNDTPSCSGGVCSIQCAPGYGNCDNSIATGCETTLNTVANCGVCSPAGTCSTQNGVPACNTTTSPPSCAVGSCSMGYANCPGNGTNCSTFILGNDTGNCGGCNQVCGSDATSNGSLHDSGACVAGTCTIGTCDPGWADCDGNVSNGCETAIDTVSHCGACNISCSTANGTPECSPSGSTFVCGIQSCTSPWIHCAANGGTNCETNPTSDNNNCGGCGNVCDVATCGSTAGHVATTTCTGGVCDITTCSSGYTYTDAKCSDGLYCDCALSTVATTCGSGSQNLGTVPVGANPITYVSNLYPAAPNQAYFVVTFTGNTNTSYHPKITISDPLNEFLIEVTSDCSTAITTCNATGDATSSNGVTAWEESYVGPNPPADNTTYPVTGDAFEAIPPVGNNGVVYVKVYRKGAVTNCNNQYTLTVAN